MTTPRTPATYGFIGLGHQGTPMAQRMIDDGLRPWLWARRPEVLERYRSADAQLASSPADLAARCDVIGLCLYDAAATESVLYGPDGVMSSARPGTVLAMHATVGPDYIRDLAQRTETQGVRIVDAPVSGGDAALSRQLLVILGGDDDARARCRPVLDTYAGKIVEVGGVGAAQAAKVVNNALFMAITGLVFDAFAIGQLLGVDRDDLADVLGSGSAANPSVGIYRDLGAEQFSIRGWPTLQKDLELIEEVARRHDAASTELVTTAAASIREMERLRTGYVEQRRCNVE